MDEMEERKMKNKTKSETLTCYRDVRADVVLSQELVWF